MQRNWTPGPSRRGWKGCSHFGKCGCFPQRLNTQPLRRLAVAPWASARGRGDLRAHRDPCVEVCSGFIPQSQARLSPLRQLLQLRPVTCFPGSASRSSPWRPHPSLPLQERPKQPLVWHCPIGVDICSNKLLRSLKIVQLVYIQHYFVLVSEVQHSS